MQHTHTCPNAHNGLGAGFTFRHVLNVPHKGSIVVPCIALRSRFEFICIILVDFQKAKFTFVHQVKKPNKFSEKLKIQQR